MPPACHSPALRDRLAGACSWSSMRVNFLGQNEGCPGVGESDRALGQPRQFRGKGKVTVKDHGR